MLDTTAHEIAIVNQLAAKTGIPASRIWDTEVPNGTPSPAYPYLVLYWGTPSETYGEAHITSPRNNVLSNMVAVETHARDAKTARQVNNLVRNALIGFVPTDCGPMRTISGGASYSEANTMDTTATEYMRTTYFSYLTNMSWNA